MCDLNPSYLLYINEICAFVYGSARLIARLMIKLKSLETRRLTIPGAAAATAYESPPRSSISDPSLLLMKQDLYTLYNYNAYVVVSQHRGYY